MLKKCSWTQATKGLCGRKKPVSGLHWPQKSAATMYWAQMGKGSDPVTVLSSQGFLNIQEGGHFPSHTVEKQQGQERNPTLWAPEPWALSKLVRLLPEYGLAWEIGTLLTVFVASSSFPADDKEQEEPGDYSPS